MSEIKSAKQSNLAFLLLMALSLHIYAYVYWRDWKLVNIYYVTLYFLFYIFSLTLYIIASNKWLKLVSTLTLTISGYCLYLEFTGDPSNWTWQNMASGFLSILTSAVTILIIKKLKR